KPHGGIFTRASNQASRIAAPIAPSSRAAGRRASSRAATPMTVAPSSAAHCSAGGAPLRVKRGIRSSVTLGLELTRDCRDASPPTPGRRLRAPGRRLLRGRIKGGGRAVLQDKGAATHSIFSSVRATPHPFPPHERG